MAKEKKSFVLYTDLIHTVKKLSKEDAGELFVHLLEYVNDMDPKTENVFVDLVFEPIKHQLKRDLKGYEKVLEAKSLNGRIGNLKRWHLDLYNKYVLGELSIEDAEKIAIDRKSSLSDTFIANVADNVNGTVTVIVNDNVTDIVNKDVVPLKDSSNLPQPLKIDYDQLILFFNQRRGVMPEVKIISDARKKRLKSILKNHSKEDLKKVILLCEKLDFLQGRNYKNWIGSFDWITTPANFIKILEGNYNNNTSTNGKSESKPTEPLFGRQTAATVRANLSGWENLE